MLTFGGSADADAVLNALRQGIAGFDRLAIAVSYVQLSGWRLLNELLDTKAAAVRLLCTDQFGITDPAAVRAALAAGVDVRAYAGPGVYHPKVFIASRAGQADRWLTGSANLSAAALRTSVEAVVAGEDAGEALAWFDRLFDQHGAPFDEARLLALEASFAARLKGNLAIVRTRPPMSLPVDQVAVEAVEAVFASLPALVVPLNADKAGNNVRTLRRIKEVLDDSSQLAGKALSEFKLIGLAQGGDYSPLGRSLRGKSLAEIARGWVGWLKHAPEAEIAAANPSGRLARGRIAFATFWSMPAPVRDFFLTHATAPDAVARPLLQVIELLANAGRPLPALSLADVDTLSALVREPDRLPSDIRAVVGDYLENKGTRGWGEPDRVLALNAWRDS